MLKFLVVGIFLFSIFLTHNIRAHIIECSTVEFIFILLSFMLTHSNFGKSFFCIADVTMILMTMSMMIVYLCTRPNDWTYKIIVQVTDCVDETHNHTHWATENRWNKRKIYIFIYVCVYTRKGTILCRIVCLHLELNIRKKRNP